MKLTKSKLREIIREEIQKLNEAKDYKIKKKGSHLFLTAKDGSYEFYYFGDDIIGDIKINRAWGQRIEINDSTNRVKVKGAGNKLYKSFNFKNVNLLKLAADINSYLMKEDFIKKSMEKKILSGLRAFIDLSQIVNKGKK